jgi:glucokinase
MLQRLAIGIDIGGSKVAAGVVDADGGLRELMHRETPSGSARDVEDTVASLVADLRRRHEVVAVGIGAAGFIDSARATVLFSPHLAWRHEPLRDAVHRRTGMSVVVENDANAAAWAEWRFGAAQNEPDLVCLTLGTGIGGALVLGGQLYRGRNGVAGEFGHQQLVPDGRPCECGNRGCWEQYASGNVLLRAARAAVGAGEPTAHALAEICGGAPERLVGTQVTELAERNDPLAVELYTEIGTWLGVGIANLAAGLDPGVFVIGGGVSDAGELLLAPARAAYRRTLTGGGYRPEARIVQAHLGNTAGLIGAADLARSARRRRSSRSRSSGRSRRARWSATVSGTSDPPERFGP